MITHDPCSTEMRYTLDLMLYALQASEPSSVRIASRSIEVVKAALRRLACMEVALFVEDEAMQAMARDVLGLAVGVSGPGSDPADAALFPFSLNGDVRLPWEPTIVVACENALSYKPLLYPGRVEGTVFGQMRKLKAVYSLEPVAGLYSPRFVLWRFMAQLVGRFDSAWWFRLEDLAMRRLINYGPLWRLSYLVVFAGRASG
jgi:hypothetical protein